ncbi:Fe-S cluster assembly protein SufD [Maribellus comscasis]|uniref:Fe-S cluster assembly protein SufD n=1 Tax=Maribellus comscasis TaxID=2681766 RepID=A0A6I6JR59_9BACT|nr:Fe-S cluster assembly protein SufD [Maribellus comscasis]QGY43558.1 Fe-S cluster assembly protein SufD [Maribellus comscasis]
MSVLVEKADLSLKYTGHYNEVKDLLFEGSSHVLNAQRNKAFQDFVMQGIPTRKNENYKYTNLQPQFLPEYKFIHQREEVEADLNEVFRCDVPQLDTHLTLLINGWYYQKNKEAELPEGVILGSLEELANNNPELIEKYYAKIAKTEEDPLVALNTAFAKDGYFLYIPKNVTIEKPLQLINLLQSDKDTYATQRNLIIVESGASLQLLLCNHTLDLNTYLSNSVTEIFVGENAHLDYYTLQNEHNKATSLNSVFIQQERDSTATTHTSSLHGGLIRNNLKFVLNGENAESNMYGMSFIDKKQHVDNFTQVIHAQPHCQSNQLYKNVLNDQSTGAFAGRIHVMRDAQKTNAFQRNNNLLLTDAATMQTKPQLIIDADDVKCSHGATVGQIDEEALFYLRARGIGENKARLMMMNAFAHEVVQEIKIEALRERIDDLVDKRLKGEVARCHECAYNCEC